MDNTGKVFWNRAGYVEIENQSGNMVRYGGSNDSLDFKFSGSKIGDLVTDFDVGILGLSAETIKDLTIWRPFSDTSRYRRIKVFAGYSEDSLINPIFDGYIFNAVPTTPPEMWLEMKCVSYIKNTKPIEPFSMNATGMEIAQKVFSLTGLGGGLLYFDMKNPSGTTNPESLQREMKFTFQGLPQHIVHDFAAKTRAVMFHENGMLFWVESKLWYTGRVQTSISRTVNLDNGMIEMPKVDYKGVIVKMRLDDDIPFMKRIDFRSKMIPSADGLYVVNSKKHVGHFRGDEWYTELELRRTF